MIRVRYILLLLFLFLALDAQLQNKALYFYSDYSWVHYPEVFPEAPEDFTVEFWIKPYSTKNFNNRLQGGYDNWMGAFTLHTDKNGSIYAGNNIDMRFTPYDIPARTIETGEWQHLAFTYSINGEAKFYKDGDLIASKAGVSQSTAWNGFCLGFPYIASGSFDGFVDEVRVWNTCRSQNEIDENYNIPLSGNEEGLYSYWNFNHDNDTVSIDSGVNGFNGQIYGCTHVYNDNPHFQGNNYPEIKSRNTIWFDKPADASIRKPWELESQWMLHNPDPNWEHYALPIGNSFMGAMIYGSVAEERIQFNEKSVWEGGPHVPGYYSANKAGSYQYIAEIREHVVNGDTTAATELAKQHLTGHWSSESPFFGNYQTFGELIINTGINEEEMNFYERVLSLDSALATVRLSIKDTLYSRNYFCSYPDHVMVMMFSADKSHCQNQTVYFESPHDHTISFENNTAIISGNLEMNNLGIAARLHVKAIGGNVGFTDNQLHINNADSVIMILSTDTEYVLDYPDFKGVDPLETTEDWIEAAKEKSYQQLKKRHIQDFQNLFNRVNLILNDDNGDHILTTEQRVIDYKYLDKKDSYLESLFFQMGRYLQISSSREGDLPGNLQGVWNNRIYPGWNSDYHLNINLQMNYWMTDVCNLSACFTPFSDYVKMLSEAGEETAQSYYNAPGWSTNLISNPYGHSAPSSFDNMYWSFYPLSGAWLCQNMWDHYEFTKDLNYLQNDAYPVMRSQADFITSMLYEFHPDTLVSCPSWSPEHGSVSVGTTHDHQMIRDLLTNTIEAAEILQVDSLDRIIWHYKRNRIAPNKIGQYGQLQEWYDDIDNPEDQHRHISHLYGLHPGKEISPLLNQEFSDAAKVTLMHRGDLSTGWSMAWKTLFNARLLDGNHAYQLLNTLIKNEVMPNMLDKCEILFNIDGNLGASAGIAEMLVQSHLDTVFVLPAVPEEWASGEVLGLKARGNYTLSFDWENGTVLSGTITAGNDGLCRLYFNNCFVEFLAEAGVTYPLDCYILGSEEIPKKQVSPYTVSPIPCQTDLIISINNLEYLNSAVVISDISGNRISHCMIADKDNQLDVSALKAGTYVLRISKGNESHTFKIIKI